MQSGKSGAKPKPSKKKTQDKARPAASEPKRAPPGFSAAPAPPSGFSDEHRRLLRHRALFAFRFLVGKAVDVQLADGARFAGVLDCVDPDDFSLVLKSAKRLSESAGPFESGSTVIFKRQQIAHIAADGVVNYAESALPTAAASGFRTDTEISGKKTEHLFGRELEVASSWLDPSLDAGGLEEPRRRSSKNNWNQFEANQKLFGVVSGFDENLYTTKLDKTKLSVAQSRDAERIAQEIERQASSNFHLQEERGQRVQDDGLDEEARYSSVDRSKGGAAPSVRGPNSYVPPALRNAQRQTSGGAKAKGDKNASAPSPLPSSAAAQTGTPAPKTTPGVTLSDASTKPLSFSDAVKGRSSASPALSAQPAPSAPTSAPLKQVVSVEFKKGDTASPKANGKEGTNETKKLKASDNKANETKQASAKEPSKSKASETKAKESKADAKADAKSDGKADEAPKKKSLNPNAKEFKLSATAAEFTPTFAQPAAYPASGMYPPPQGYQMPYQQMGMPPYGPSPDEWGYDGMGVPMEEGAEMMSAPYGYGVPMAPNGMMPMYPPMMPPQQNVRMSGGNRGHSQHGYNQRGYYNGGYGGGYHGNGRSSGGPAPQPPLPREPSPGASDTADPPAQSEDGDTSKSQPVASPTKKTSKK